MRKNFFKKYLPGPGAELNERADLYEWPNLFNWYFIYINIKKSCKNKLLIN